ncbi:MAG: hypothetical protein GY715_12750 [Planctomycetes bacterium]|nr:hypothetical protein [Planctomycetota bacterium]
MDLRGRRFRERHRRVRRTVSALVERDAPPAGLDHRDVGTRDHDARQVPRPRGRRDAALSRASFARSPFDDRHRPERVRDRGGHRPVGARHQRKCDSRCRDLPGRPRRRPERRLRRHPRHHRRVGPVPRLPGGPERQRRRGFRRHPGGDRVLGAVLAAVSPDGRLISGAANGVIRVFDPETGAQLQLLVGHEDKDHRGLVKSVAFSPDGTRIASTSRDSTVRIWNAARD